ncbi:MAG: glycosyltransferase family 9 protein [Acidobacteriota bacterium]
MNEVANEVIKPDWSRIEKVLLVRLRSIGDTVLMTPCLAALKAFRPEINIAVVSEPLAAPLLDRHPLVDQLFVTESKFSSRAQLIRRLRREHFDIAFNMHGGSTANFLTRLSGATITVGYAGQRYSSLLNFIAPAPDVILGRSTIHSVEQQLALLNYAGVPLPDNPQLNLSVDETAKRNVLERLAGLKLLQDGNLASPLAIVSPAAAFSSKQWAEEKFAEVAKYIFDNWQMPSLLIAASHEQAVVEKVASLADCPTSIFTDLNLKELMALISLSSLFVGNDSGPMHIAATFKRPLVAIFGSSNATVWRPWTDAPCAVVRGRQSVAGNTDERIENSIKNIAVDEVIDAVDAVMRRAN